MRWLSKIQLKTLALTNTLIWVFSCIVSAQTFSGQGNMPVPTPPQNMFGTTISPVTVSGIGTLGGCFQVSSVTINVTTPWPQGLNFVLISPDGSMLELASMCGGFAGQNFTNTTFTDYGAQFITTAFSPATGNWRPEGRNNTPPWSNNWPTLGTYTFNNTFSGKNADGVWNLYIESNAWVGQIHLIDWSITFGTNQPTGNSLSPSSCNTGAGIGTFNLTSLSNSISPSGFPVSFYTDPSATNLITNPASFSTPSTSVYAVVENPPCYSDPIPIPLNVTNTPLPAGFGFSLNPSTNCGPVSGSWNYNFGPSLYWWEYTATSPTGTLTSALTVPQGSYSSPYYFTEDLIVTINYVTDAITGCEYQFPPMSDTFDLVDPPSLDIVQPTPPCAGEPVNLANSVTSNANSVTYHSSTPPTPANQVNPSVIQTSPGVYTYYALASNGNGCSQTMPITYQVLPSTIPALTSTSTCSTCVPIDLTTLQDPNFPNGTWSGQGVSGNMFDPTGQSGSVSLTFTPSGGGPCTLPGTTTIQVTNIVCPNPANLSACDQGGGIGTFNLTSLNTTVNGGNGAAVNYFTNSSATIPITSPSTYASMGGTIYAVVNGGGCPTTPVPIVLTVTPTPLAAGLGISLNPTTSCTPTMGTFIWNLGSGSFIVNSTYTNASGSFTSTQTLASQILTNWGCNQDHTLTVNSITDANTGCELTFPPMSVSFDLLDPPSLTVNPSTPICAGQSFDLSTLINTNGTNITFHSASPPHVTNQIPSIVTPTVSGANTYYVLVSGGSSTCTTSQAITLSVLPSGTPTLGTATMCALANPFNLTTIQDPLYPNGTWSGAGVTGTMFNPFGQAGQVILTYTPLGTCTIPTNTTISVTPPTPPTPASLTVCDQGSGTGIFNLTTLNTTINNNAGSIVQYSLDMAGLLSIVNTSSFTSTSTTIYATVISGCSAGTVPVVLTVDAPTAIPSNASVQFNPTTGCGPTPGIITVDMGAPGVYNFSASFTTPSGTMINNSLFTLPNGLYSVPYNFMSNYTMTLLAVTGPNGCVFTVPPLSANFTIVPATPISVNNPAAICAGTIVDLSANAISAGPITFHTGLPANGANQLPNPIVTPLTTTTYYASNQLAPPCGQTLPIVVSVMPSTTPVLGTATVCSASGNLNLTSLLDPNVPNGTWSGPGVIGNTFVPAGQNGPVVITFTPASTCSPAASTTITVIPSDVPMLGTTTLCSAASPLHLGALADPNYPFGTWSGQAVSGNFFNPTGLSGPISIVFTPSSQCVTTASTVITVVPAQIPSLHTAQICENANPLNLNTIVDPLYPTGIWTGPGVIGNTFQPAGQSGPITLIFTSGLPCVLLASTVVQVNQLYTPSLLTTTLCQNSGQLNLQTLLASTPSNGVWSGPGVTNNFFQPSGQSGAVSLVFTPGTLCSEAASTIVEINAPLQTSTPVFDCQGSSNYTVQFDILGGAPGQYLVNGLPTPSSFASAPITSGGNYNFTITDQNGCGPITLSGDYDCSCITFSGTMQITGPQLQICQNQSATAIFNQNQQLDPDDILLYVLHDNAGSQLGNVLATSASPTFAFPVGANLNTTYFISAVAGTANGSGGMILTDPCLSVSQGVPVQWYALSVQGQIQGQLCPTDCLSVPFTTTGVPPLRLVIQIDGPNGAALDTFLFTSNTSNLSICPEDYGLGIGGYQLTAIQLSDPNCLSSLNQVIGNFQTSIASAQVAPTLCQGESLTIGNQVFTQGNPTGTVVLNNAAASGCDSLVYVNLQFAPSANANITQQLCTGGSLVVGTTLFDATHPSGVVVLSQASASGCDSIVQVNLTFALAVYAHYRDTLCFGQTVTVAGQTFSQLNPSGNITLTNASVLGCDSIIQVDIAYLPPANSSFVADICMGSSIQIGSQTFDAGNLSGTVLLAGAASTGCDSIVQVNLTLGNSVVNYVSQTLCQGQSLMIGNQTFNQANPTGMVLFPNGSVAGCDSVVQVNLSFSALAQGQMNQSLCPGESIVIGGIVFNSSNPIGTAILPGAAATGCDSVVIVNLNFVQSASMQVIRNICPNETVMYGGSAFGASNPIGTVLLIGAAQGGCDSIIEVILTVLPEAMSTYTATLCAGETISVGNQTFHQGHPTGTVVLPQSAASGCDSMVHIALQYHPLSTFDLHQQLCTGASITIGSQTFNESNTSGTVTLAGASIYGCDSVVIVDLSFGNLAINYLQTKLCHGESMQVGNQTYSAANPSGSVLFPNGSYLGCDSLVQVSLSFYPAAVGTYTSVLCTGASYTVGNQIFDQANPIGEVVLTAASVTGCDSTVQVALQFNSPQIGYYQATLCTGEQYTLGNQVFDAANPSGQVLLPSASTAGCDSLVQVNINFSPSANTSLIQQLCPGGTLTVGTTIFDIDHPIGSVTLANASYLGCDSVVLVNLSFGTAVVNDLHLSLCAGETFAVGAEIFSTDRPTGSVVFHQGAVFGCDSIVQVTVEPIAPAVSQINALLCVGDTIWVHGTAYHAMHNEGVEIFQAASTMGCDSTIEIEVQFYPIAEPFYLDTVLQLTDTIVVNGTVYSFINQVGEEVLQTENGCDSTVYIKLKYEKTGKISVPNVFSPTGVVPYLTVYGGAEVIEIERFEVYSRWGELMFSRSNFAPNIPELGWDGDHSGKAMNPGVYVYVAIVRLVDHSQLIFKGDVTLVK